MRGLEDIELVYQLLSKGCPNIAEYQARAFYNIFPTGFLVTSDIIYAAEGVVAGWNVLWEPTTKSSGILQIRVCVGNIRRDGFTYCAVKEEVDLTDLETCVGIVEA